MPTQKGCVNFPMGDPRYRDTGEGGMLVRLVVEDTDDRWVICNGGGNSFRMDHLLIGSDDFVYPDGEPTRDRVMPHVLHHFPNCGGTPGLADTTPYEMVSRYFSRDYLAVITIGSTDWSGWNITEGRMWTCSHTDLNQRGRELWLLMHSMYPDSRVVLQTWLDT